MKTTLFECGLLAEVKKTYAFLPSAHFIGHYEEKDIEDEKCPMSRPGLEYINFSQQPGIPA